MLTQRGLFEMCLVSALVLAILRVAALLPENRQALCVLAGEGEVWAPLCPPLAESTAVPVSASIRYLRATRLLARGQVEDARSLLEPLPVFPARLEPLLLARVLWASGQEQDAVALFGRYYPNREWQFVQERASSLFQERRIEEAATALLTWGSDAVWDEPSRDRQQFYESSYLILHRAGRFEASARLAGNLTVLFPDVSRYWRWLGSALLEHGDIAAATTAFERALAAEPSAENHLWYGMVLRVGGDRPSARRQMQRSIALDPAYFAARIELARLDHASGNDESARTQLQYVLEHSPDLQQISIATRLLGEWRLSP